MNRHVEERIRSGGYPGLTNVECWRVRTGWSALHNICVGNLTPGLRRREGFSDKVDPVLTLPDCVITVVPGWGAEMKGKYCVIETYACHWPEHPCSKGIQKRRKAHWPPPGTSLSREERGANGQLTSLRALFDVGPVDSAAAFM